MWRTVVLIDSGLESVGADRRVGRLQDSDVKQNWLLSGLGVLVGYDWAREVKSGISSFVNRHSVYSNKCLICFV